MNLFSIVTGYLTGKFRDGSKDVAIHQFKSGGKAQTALSCLGPGIEINPANGENLVIVPIKNSTSFIVSIGGINQEIAPDTARGERRIYSVSEDGKSIKAIAKFKNDGVLELNNNGDFAVRYLEMKSAFDEITGDFNNLVSALDSIISGPPIPEPGNGAPSAFQTALAASFLASAPINSTADMSDAKVETIKIPDLAQEN